MSEDITVSFPPKVQKAWWGHGGNQDPALRLRNTRMSETSPGHSVAWVLSHQATQPELETQFQQGMRETELEYGESRNRRHGRAVFLNYSINLVDSVRLRGDLERILSEVIIWILLL